ncbi:hypothetical protein B0J14DRAFT_633233 [Halenospora varia]|nr:hypothetical protein B0J14DRAFT_633233 [Halenospora varia]
METSCSSIQAIFITLKDGGRSPGRGTTLAIDRVDIPSTIGVSAFEAQAVTPQQGWSGGRASRDLARIYVPSLNLRRAISCENRERFASRLLISIYCSLRHSIPQLCLLAVLLGKYQHARQEKERVFRGSQATKEGKAADMHPYRQKVEKIRLGVLGGPPRRAPGYDLEFRYQGPDHHSWSLRTKNRATPILCPGQAEVDSTRLRSFLRVTARVSPAVMLQINRYTRAIALENIYTQPLSSIISKPVFIDLKKDSLHFLDSEAFKLIFYPHRKFSHPPSQNHDRAPFKHCLCPRFIRDSAIKMLQDNIQEVFNFKRLHTITIERNMQRDHGGREIQNAKNVTGIENMFREVRGEKAKLPVVNVLSIARMRTVTHWPPKLKRSFYRGRKWSSKIERVPTPFDSIPVCENEDCLKAHALPQLETVWLEEQPHTVSYAHKHISPHAGPGVGMVFRYDDSRDNDEYYIDRVPVRRNDLKEERRTSTLLAAKQFKCPY